jgi:hypothetical protein
LAAQMNNFFFTTGPVLCFIPDGPHIVRFAITRNDYNQVNGGTGNCILSCIFKITPADTKSK